MERRCSGPALPDIFCPRARSALCFAEKSLIAEKEFRFFKFGYLKVIDEGRRPGRLLCLCWCGNYEPPLYASNCSARS